MTKRSLVWSAAWAPLWILVLHPWWQRQKRKSLWVVGGHRGRDYADNSGALHAEASRQGRDAFFIARRDLEDQLQTKGVKTLRQGSFAARRAISRAETLIYSHGEDDLDPAMILLRGRTSARVYLGHSLSLMKGGGVTDPFLRKASWAKKALLTWLMTDCDHFLYSSEAERENFALCYPQHRSKLIEGGGAHLDFWFQGASLPVKKRIFWFPTFRDTKAGNALLRQQIRKVLDNSRLKEWLLEHDYELVLGTHINTKKSDHPVKIARPFRLAEGANWVDEIRQSALLISDYSGVVFDFLALERPQLLFAFDLLDYQKTRHLLVDYPSIDFALQPTSVDELVACIVEERYLEPSLQKKIQKARAHYLPAHEGSFARASVEAIAQALETPR